MIRPATWITVAATIVVWTVVLLSGLTIGFEHGITLFALVAAIGSTVALWLVWAFMSLDELSKASKFEKEKRSAPGEDARLSVLLSLMDDDERQNLRKRLRDELSTDGEAVALDDLLFQKRSRS